MPGGAFGCCLPRKARASVDGTEPLGARAGAGQLGAGAGVGTGAGGGAQGRPEELHAKFLAMLDAMERPVAPSVDDDTLMVRPAATVTKQLIEQKRMMALETGDPSPLPAP